MLNYYLKVTIREGALSLAYISISLSASLGADLIKLHDTPPEITTVTRHIYL
jgi:uncharacterized membrane protein